MFKETTRLARRVRALGQQLARTFNGFRKRRYPTPPVSSGKDTGATRRQLLGRLAVLPIVGLAGGTRRGRADDLVDATLSTKPVIVTDADAAAYWKLRNSDLNAPEIIQRRQTMPTGQIGDLTLGRLISGSNLISMNMHARDLDYVTDLARGYNTEERIFMTLKRCEQWGANSIVLKDHNFKHFRLRDYWTNWGGQMHWHADVITTNIDEFEQRVAEHLDLGASTVYLWGGASDIWWHQGKQGNIVKAYEIMRSFGIPVGIGAHRLEPIEFCEREGLKPDYYIKTLHHDRYWSAHPPENRRFMEMYEAESPEHNQYHDNMFCHAHQETVDFMQDVDIPWIAFKVLAAGAIAPEEGIQFAFDSGADFVCLGMFDFQVDEDAALVRQCVARAQNRKRPWA